MYHATNHDTPFVVTETSFSDLRDKTEDELEDMLEVLKMQFIEEFPNGKGITCFYSGLDVVPLTHAGSAMLSFDQGNPTRKSDDLGQTWKITTWLMNCYKGDMSPVQFHRSQIASSHQKISGENDGSSWCPFSVSQVIRYENVRWVSHKILLVVWSVQT
jgi:hypothetical protein